MLYWAGCPYLAYWYTAHTTFNITEHPCLYIHTVVPPGEVRTQEVGVEGKGSAADSGQSKPPQRPPRPHITVYQKYITASSMKGEEPTAKRRERKTVGHIYLPDSPPPSPPRPPTDSYREYMSPSSSTKSGPVEVEVEIKNGSDEGSLSPSGVCVGNTLMKRYQAPVAGEVIEETEAFEYPDWARNRTKMGKGTRKTRIGDTQCKEKPRQRQPGMKLKSLLSLCSGRGMTGQDCSNTDEEFGKCSSWLSHNTTCHNMLTLLNCSCCNSILSHLQLFLALSVQICTCFLLHCVLLYKKQLQMIQS